MMTDTVIFVFGFAISLLVLAAVFLSRTE